MSKMQHDRQYFFGESGQKLLVQEWGPSHQPVVLLIHGFPGCADHAGLMSGTPLWNSFRLISLDRPGYGQSEAQKKITPLKFAQQVKSLLAHLEIDEISIISVSGGAPYSMAVAFLMGDRVRKMTSIGGVAPLSLGNFRYMNSLQKKTWLFRNFVPDPLLRYVAHGVWQRGFEKMEEFFFTDLSSFSLADRKVLEDPILGPELMKTMRTALQKGPDGVLSDMRVFSRGWGFPLKHITCPTTLWHGRQDDVVHYKFAEEMKRQLPQANVRFVEKEGHYSLLVNCRDEILADLLSSSLDGGQSA